MQAELTKGLQELIGTDAAEACTFGGVSFNALIDDEVDGDNYGRPYRTGDRFDSVLIVDPSVSAFTSATIGDNLPAKSQNVIHTATSRKYTVERVEFSDGSHVAFLHCRKGAV